ncbi:MAG TPA: hypothetical protein GX401_06225 [Clostridiales bacterium]|nr:hypothetical protein [Clostridiales bacterium]
MSNFRQKFMEFMYGRYGNDKLNIALFVLWLILSFVNIFVHNIFFWMFTYVPVALGIYRFLSKNSYKRSQENQKFMVLFSKFLSWLPRARAWCSLQLRKCKDFKTHRYLKCPYCKATVRVPNKKGKHTICCPKCREDFHKNILF